jgi:hypothetical protein
MPRRTKTTSFFLELLKNEIMKEYENGSQPKKSTIQKAFQQIPK